MNIDERTNAIWQHISKIADEDPERAYRLINVDRAPLWLYHKLSELLPDKF